MTLAAGWAITEVDWSGNYITAVDGLDAPTPPNVLQLVMRWRLGDDFEIGDKNCQTGPLMVSCVPLEPAWDSTYDFKVHAVGPVGVSYYPPSAAPPSY